MKNGENSWFLIVYINFFFVPSFAISFMRRFISIVFLQFVASSVLCSVGSCL